MEEKNYPTVKKPKRQLCYLTSKEREPKHWETLWKREDVLLDDDLPPSPPLQQTCDVEPVLNELEVSPIPLKGSVKDVPLSATRLPSSKPDVALDIPFKGHQPGKTSSPIYQNMDVKSVEKQDKGKVKAAVPGRMTSFLQKLKETGESKQATSRKSVYPVKVPLPEPMDDFITLEDDVPFTFFIPSKNAPSKRQQQSKSLRSDKHSSADGGTNKDIAPEKPHRQEQLEKADRQMEDQIVLKKSKKKMEELKNDDVTSPGCITDKLLAEQKKKKKEQLKKVWSRELNKVESEPEEGVNSEAVGFSQKTKARNRNKSVETKARKSAESWKQKSAKDGETNTQTSRTKPSKRPRKKLHGSDGVEEMINSSLEKPIASEAFSTPTENQFEKSDSNGNAKQKEAHGASGGSSDTDYEVGKRKRKPTGLWWLVDSSSPEDASSPECTVKKSKQSSKKQIVAHSPVKGKNGKVLKKGNKAISPKLSWHTVKAKGKKTKRDQQRNTSDGTIEIKAATFEVSKKPAEEQPEERQQQDGVSDPDLDQEQSSPSVSPHGELSTKSVSEGSTQPEEELSEVESAKRRRKPTGSWWMVNNTSSSPTPQLQPKKPKPHQQRKKQANCKKSPELSTPGSMDTLPHPAEGAPAPLLEVKPLFTPKNVKSSLEKFTDIVTSNINTPRVPTVRHTQQDARQEVASHPVKENAAGDHRRTKTVTVSVDDGESSSPVDNLHKQESSQDGSLQVLVSGPTSTIDLKECDETENRSFLSSQCQAQLSLSDLCSCPLKPLILQPQDKSNLAEWFTSLWVTLAENHKAVTPDHFEWYFYKDKVIGFQEDLNSGPICTGKMLLGSYMKKPLWVDHSATTVFNLLSSSVTITIDGSVSNIGPGQSFMVQCGQAYSIRNTTKQPAILYFTRILSESSD